MSELEASIKENTKYIVVNQPYNPGGTMMTTAEQARLKEIAHKRGIYVMSDEVVWRIRNLENLENHDDT